MTFFRLDTWTSRSCAARLVAVLVLVFVSFDAAAMERVDAMTLDASAGRSKAVFTSGDGHWAYVVCDGAEPPNQLVKIDLTTFNETSSVDFADNGAWAAGPVAAMDPFGTFIYVAYNADFSLKITKVNTVTMTRVATGDIDYLAQSLVVDALGDYAYVGTDEGIVEKIDLASMQVVGQVDTGQPFLRSAAIDPGNHNLYLGTDTGPAQVVKIDLATFQLVDVLTFAGGETGFRSVVIDPTGTSAYFGTYVGIPAEIAKVDLATFQPAGTIVLDENVFALRSAAIDRTGTYAYFGSTSYPPRLVKVDLASFQVVDSVVFDGSDGALMSIALGSDGQEVYGGTDNLPGRVVKVALQDPAPNVLRFDPSYLDFYNVELGDSQTRTATLENAGTDPASALSFASSVPDGMSVDTTSCGMTLAAGATCEVQLTYAPTLADTLGVEWSVSSGEGATGHLLLLGRAVPDHSGAQITPAALDFGGVALGATSAPQAFTLTNTSGTQIPVVMFQPDGDGAQDFDVDTSACDILNPGDSCVVQVQFHPSRVAPDSVSLHLNSPDADVRIALAGYGVQVADSIVFDQTSLDFGSVTVGQTVTRSVTLHNVGYDVASDLQFSTSDGAFSVNSELCTVIAPSAICILDVMFTPVTAGPASAVLTLTTGEGLHLELPMSGSGGGSPPNLVFDVSDIDFGPVGVGTAANPQTVVLRNDGEGAAFVTGFLLMSPFEANGDDCMPQIDPGQTCTIRIGYTPTHAGKDLDTLVVITDQGPSAQLLVSGSGSTDAIFQGGFD